MNSLLMDLKYKQLFAVQFAKVTHVTEAQRGSTRCVLKVALTAADVTVCRHGYRIVGRWEKSELSVAPPVL